MTARPVRDAGTLPPAGSRSDKVNALGRDPNAAYKVLATAARVSFAACGDDDDGGTGHTTTPDGTKNLLPVHRHAAHQPSTNRPTTVWTVTAGNHRTS